MANDASKKFKSFREFYPYYLTEHANPKCRALHYIGSTLAVLIIIAALALQQWWWLLAVPVVGYGFAWAGHFFFEHNRPATFKHPWYSLLGDWVMYAEFLRRSLGAGKDHSGSR
ncbi:Mpo1-like protein [Pseudidiomarina sp. E22-M8]|uniref:Mpo1-like protein n=1 Tax=Pseudidiomarina sp. E22-M8 TaxID=3424768 RepID=UPI00403CEAF8